MTIQEATQDSGLFSMHLSDEHEVVARRARAAPAPGAAPRRPSLSRSGQDPHYRSLIAGTHKTTGVIADPTRFGPFHRSGMRLSDIQPAKPGLGIGSIRLSDEQWGKGHLSRAAPAPRQRRDRAAPGPSLALAQPGRDPCRARYHQLGHLALGPRLREPVRRPVDMHRGDHLA
jgi:hypothetical protein